MLPLPRFAWQAPDTLHGLLDAAARPGARILAGGTDLLPSMKHRLHRPSLLVSARRLPELAAIYEDGDDLCIGAFATLRAVRRHPVVRAELPALADACATVATPTIQAMGTLGGNLCLDTRCAFYNQPEGWRQALGGCLKADGDVCHVARKGAGCYAAHSADTVPVLWLLGARARIAGRRGTREVPVSELYDGADGRRWLRLEPGEVLTHVLVPRRGAPVVHHKVRLRASIDYAALLVAVRREGSGARAVISAVGPAPVEVRAARAEELPDLAHARVKPLGTHVVSTAWRRHMVRVAVRRALDACPVP